jgi:hypothetical protein
MPNLTLTFNNPLPVTLQVGDEVWFLDVDTGQEIKLGILTDITDLILTIDIVTGASLPEPGVDFIFFKKDTRAHLGQLKVIMQKRSLETTRQRMRNCFL